jgi:hypothetical protein
MVVHVRAVSRHEIKHPRPKVLGAEQVDLTFLFVSRLGHHLTEARKVHRSFSFPMLLNPDLNPAAGQAANGADSDLGKLVPASLTALRILQYVEPSDLYCGNG